jgi:hypothetical protein
MFILPNENHYICHRTYIGVTKLNIKLFKQRECLFSSIYFLFYYYFLYALIIHILFMRWSVVYFMLIIASFSQFI